MLTQYAPHSKREIALERLFSYQILVSCILTIVVGILSHLGAKKQTYSNTDIQGENENLVATLAPKEAEGIDKTGMIVAIVGAALYVLLSAAMLL